MVRRACLVSGGTGGHLWPAIVLASALRAHGDETVLVTEGRSIERELLDRAGVGADSLEFGRGGRAPALGFVRAAWRARRLLRERDVDFVISTGGRSSLAVGLAARSLGLPLFLLEQNAVAGRANRVLLPFARRIYLGLPPTRELPRSLTTGTPVRDEFRRDDRAAARADLGLVRDVPVVLVTGGSQGADVLNEVVPDALCALRCPIQVLHVAGPGRDAPVRLRYAPGLDHDLSAHVRGVALDMATLYAAADLIVCRGGGGTVAELIAMGRPALIVPYPHHRDRQQFHNGSVLVRARAARLVEQRDLGIERATAEIRALLEDRAELDAMGRRARALAGADPCERIVADVARSIARN